MRVGGGLGFGFEPRSTWGLRALPHSHSFPADTGGGGGGGEAREEQVSLPAAWLAKNGQMLTRTSEPASGLLLRCGGSRLARESQGRRGPGLVGECLGFRV